MKRWLLMALVATLVLAAGFYYYLYRDASQTSVSHKEPDNLEPIGPFFDLSPSNVSGEAASTSSSGGITLSPTECDNLSHKAKLDAFQRPQAAAYYVPISGSMYYFAFGGISLSFCRKLEIDGSPFWAGWQAFYGIGSGTTWDLGMGRDDSSIWEDGYRLPISGKNFKVYMSNPGIGTTTGTFPAYFSTDSGVYFIPTLEDRFMQSWSTTQDFIVKDTESSHVLGADPRTFKIIGGEITAFDIDDIKSIYATDGRTVYWNTTRIDANPATFSPLYHASHLFGQYENPAYGLVYNELGVDGNDLYVQDKKILLAGGLKEMFISSVREKGTNDPDIITWYLLFSDNGGNYYQLPAGSRGGAFLHEQLTKISSTIYNSFTKEEMISAVPPL